MSRRSTLVETNVVVEERRGFLFVTPTPHFRTVGEIDRGLLTIRSAMEQRAMDRLLVDCRLLTLPLPDDACQRVWEIIHDKQYAWLALLLPASEDLMLTRINMTALSSNLPFRAFTGVMEAHRWLENRLSGIRRSSTFSRTSTASLRATSSAPPSPEAPESVRPGSMPGYGQFSHGRSDSVSEKKGPSSGGHRGG